MRHYLLILPPFLAAIAVVLFYLSSPTSQASHQPNSEIFIGVDMCPRDQLDSALAVAVDCPDANAFSAANGTMTLRTIEPCLALASWPQDSGEGGDLPVEIQVYVQNVSDLIGAQVRLNLDETKVTLDQTTVAAPFSGRSFITGPRDAFTGTPAGLTIQTDPFPTGVGTANASYLLFSGYTGTQGAGISADTPDTAPSVGAATAAPGHPAVGFESVGSASTATGAGGIWLSFKVNRDPTFTSGVADINLTASPAPASKVIVHTKSGAAATSIDLPESQLFDGAIALGGATCPATGTPPAPSAPAADTDLPEATLTTLTTPINCTAATAGASAHLWDCTVTNDTGRSAPGLTLEFERTIPDASPQPAPLNQVHTIAPAGSWEVVDWYVNKPSHCDESLTNDNRLRLSFASPVAAGATATVKVETCFLIHAATLRMTKAGWTEAAAAAATQTPSPGGATATATATARPGTTPGVLAAAPGTGGEPGANGNIWPWVYGVVGAVLISAAVAGLIWRPRRQG